MSTTISLGRPRAGEAVSVRAQVDLLPPEVRAGRKLRQTKRLLAVVVVGVVFIGALGWVYALFALRDASSELSSAQANTERLSAEQAKYSDVPAVQRQLATAQAALVAGTSTEVLWKQYLEALRAVTPAGVSYDSLSVTMSDNPTAQGSGDPLQQAGVGQIVFTARTSTVPDISSWMDAVRAVPGLSDPWFTQASLTDDQGIAYYKVDGTVQISDTALAHRFAPQSASAAAAGATPAAPTATPTDTPTGGNS